MNKTEYGSAAPTKWSDHNGELALRSGSIRRIALVGCPGAGKTIFAKKLGLELDLPVICLDSHYWRSGWTRTPQREWEKKIEAITRGKTWIAEGIFRAWPPSIILRAECVIFLDSRTFTCFRRALIRMIRGNQREELPASCRDSLDVHLLRHIWAYRHTERPEILDFMQRYPEQLRFLHFENDTAAQEWLGLTNNPHP